MIIPSATPEPTAPPTLPYPTLYVATITPDVLVRLERQYPFLAPSDQTFVDAGSSPLRRILRIAQIAFARKGGARYGIPPQCISLT
jgi:hypothetical protein